MLLAKYHPCLLFTGQLRGAPFHRPQQVPTSQSPRGLMPAPGPASATPPAFRQQTGCPPAGLSHPCAIRVSSTRHTCSHSHIHDYTHIQPHTQSHSHTHTQTHCVFQNAGFKSFRLRPSLRSPSSLLSLPPRTLGLIHLSCIWTLRISKFVRPQWSLYISIHILSLVTQKPVSWNNRRVPQGEGTLGTRSGTTGEGH